ncbi:polyphosphate polymerase domain-containing protein [Yeguia hominis]|uniref:Polyphosphate polymerase domain-containing protein n=1 Tax=Yeguia hominis TaxID=2763662 RepID=A0A926DAA1_9FIRM|nr:polyphosphate polymerase domain-containing protein [Yeguia hominis]MBC8533265.1 polyphosphate polymerase domain-containing protein [Yeguia hominis]
MAKMVFQRFEKKFLLGENQVAQLLPAISEFLELDPYCKKEKREYSIYNLYFDTDSSSVIRHSVDHPYYKEKLRLRSYRSPAGPEDRVFLEIKKKIGGVVAKRRVVLTHREAQAFLQDRTWPDSVSPITAQILDELDFYLQVHDVQPTAYISYDRTALFGKTDSSLRVTFDRNILTRRTDLRLDSPRYGTPLLSPQQRLMEIKCSGAIPIWLTRLLAEQGIYKTSFSKYGREYLAYVAQTQLKNPVAQKAI